MAKDRIWFSLPRVPEPEVMESDEEAAAYSSAAAQDHLKRLDNAFVDQVLTLGITSGLALDVGTGPGQIPIKLALRLPYLKIIGLDLSDAMLNKARHDAQASGVADRVAFQIGDATRLAFPDGHFDLVICNSLLHHVPHPLATLNELARVTRPEGAILLRDLRRPSALALPFHLAWFGRHYHGLMKKLFRDSVRAAYTEDELRELLSQSKISGGRVFRSARSHVGIERRSSQ
jgi:ubiquinone/menaquinone biosynthesis C-methylase UbiE